MRNIQLDDDADSILEATAKCDVWIVFQADPLWVYKTAFGVDVQWPVKML